MLSDEVAQNTTRLHCNGNASDRVAASFGRKGGENCNRNFKPKFRNFKPIIATSNPKFRNYKLKLHK